MNNFNEEKIVLSFGAISDIHLTGTEDINVSNYTKALRMLKSASNNSLDLICCVGDMLNMGKEIEATQFIDVLSKEIAIDTNLFYCIGNHEHYGSEHAHVAKESLYSGLQKNWKEDAFGIDLNDSFPLIGNRHAKINGYHFIAIEPDTYTANQTKFSNETLTWLKNALDIATSECPNKYIFVLTHAMIYDTCYGSNLDGPNSMWNTTELTELLSNYPQVITFGGHLHFPLNDERSIMQKSFTSLGTASVSYMACERGSYEEMRSATVMKDCRLFSQGLLVQIDEDGNIRFRKLDFFNNEEIRSPWYLESPSLDKSHLNSYTIQRSTNVSVPSFEGKTMSLENDADNNTIITFDSATNNDIIHHYIINISSNNVVVKTLKILADYYLHPQPQYMKKQWSWNVGSLENGTYEISITAIDSWNHSSTMSKTFTI